jgi:hypothetical protein
MTNPSAGRLDVAVWAPSPLGTIGPHGLLRDISAGGQTSYRPLLSHQLVDAPLADGLDRAVELIDDCDGLQALLAAPDVAQLCSAGVSAGDQGRWEREQQAAVVLRDRRGDHFQGLLVGGLHRLEAPIAHVSTFWVPNAAWLRAPGADDILAAGWLRLFRALAQRGAVGVRAPENWSGRDFVDVLRRVAGFRPAADVFAELGLSPADSAAVLVEWRATIEDQRLDHFATRPELGDPAHRELIRRLDTYFGAAPPRFEPASEPVPGERLTFTGDIGIDGVRGWGTGFDSHDWYRPPPDHVPEGSDQRDVDARAHAALAAWLRQQRDLTA